jgi:hypothetical protein
MMLTSDFLFAGPHPAVPRRLGKGSLEAAINGGHPVTARSIPAISVGF